MPSFVEVLFSLPSETLKRIIETRQIKFRGKVQDKRELAELLAEALELHRSVQDVVMRCNYRQLRLLQICTSEDTRHAFTWQTLLERAGGFDAEEDLARVMGELESIGVAFRHGIYIYVPEAVRHNTPPSLADRYSAMRLLNTYDAPTLRRICSKLGLEGEFSTKTANVGQIMKALEGSLQHLRFNPPLTQPELDVLQYMVRNGGAATPLEVAADVLGGRSDDFFRYEWQNRWKTGNERNAVDGLLSRGILYVTASGYGYNFYLVIPADLLRMLTGDSMKKLWKGTSPAPVRATEPAASSYIHENLIKDAIRLLAYFGTQEAVQTNTGHIHKTALKNALKHLSVPDEQYVTFLYCLLREADLVEPMGEKGLYTLTDTGWDWLCQPAHKQMQFLYAVWKGSVLWGEMYEEPMQKRQDYRYKWHASFLRNALLNILAASDATEEFVTLESVTAALGFQCPLALSDNHGMGLVNTFSAFVVPALTESLVWLGMVELGIARRAALNTAITGAEYANLHTADVVGVRLTTLGKQMLNGSDSPAETPPAEEQFILQANSEIFVSPYLRSDILYRVLIFTDSAAGGSVSLTKDSLRRAMDRGHALEDITQFLKTHSRIGIPQNVEYLIQEVGARHGHIHVGMAQMYLKVDSPLLLKELLARKDLKNLFVRQITDTVALISGKDIEKVLKDLRKAGYLPVSDEPSQVQMHDHDVYIVDFDSSEDGTPIALSKPVESLHLPTDPITGMPSGLLGGPLQGIEAVNWERVQKQDSENFAPKNRTILTDVAKPQGAHDNPNLIRVILANAAAGHTVVELAVRIPGEEPRRIYFEVHMVAGNTTTGYESDGGAEQLTIHVDQILWARITGRKF